MVCSNDWWSKPSLKQDLYYWLTAHEFIEKNLIQKQPQHPIFWKNRANVCFLWFELDPKHRLCRSVKNMVYSLYTRPVQTHRIIYEINPPYLDLGLRK